MRLGSADLQRLSTLLDHALELPEAERETWFASLKGDALALAPTLRELLAKHARHETGDLIDRLPAFTVAPEPAAASALAAGDTVGPYRLVRELGHGGMGEVWLAERIDGQLKRPVALKLPMLSARRSVLVQRFARERDILAALAHPHIARLYDAGLADDGQPYLALEYVEGQPITAYCDAQRLDVRARIALLRQVMAAVQFAHANLVIHRDLKPSNVLVTAQGQAMLLDFGIAKLLQDEQAHADETELTQLGGRALTLGYAAPEQISGAPVSIATDVYALGVLLYELLAGQRPFAAASRGAQEYAVLTEEPQRPSQHKAGAIGELPRGLRADLDTIVLKALKKAPAERYATVNALIEDLERFERGQPVLAQRDSTWYRTRKFIGRNALVVGGAAAVAALVLATGGVALWQASVAREQSAQARQQAERAGMEAKRAKAVQGFLLDIFRTSSSQQGDPLKAQQTTARELLDIGANRLEDALKDSPEAQIEVIGPLADIYTQLGLRSRSRDLMKRRLELARSATHLTPTARAEVVLAYADTLHEGEHRQLVPGLLQEAGAVLDAAGDTTSFARAILLFQAARFYRYGTLSEARESADRALAFMTQHHPERATIVSLQILAGYARLNAGDLAGAERSFLAGVEAANRLGERASAWLVGPLSALGEALQAQGRFADAERRFRDALAHSVKVNGEEHGETLLTRIKLANVLLQSGRTRDGLDELDRVARSFETTARARDTQWRINAAMLRASSAIERGRPDLAEGPLRDDVNALREHFPGSAVLAFRERQLAEVWVLLGRHSEAATMLDGALSKWKAVGGIAAGPASANPYALAQARLRLAQGRAMEALKHLDAVRSASEGVGLEMAHLDIERSRALLALGRPDDALQAATSALRRLDALPVEYRPVAPQADAHLLRGLALLSGGDASAALPELRAGLDLRQRHDAPDSLWVAQAQIALARCLIALRQRDGAQALLAAARRTHDALGDAARSQAGDLKRLLAERSTPATMADAPGGRKLNTAESR